MMAFSPAGFSRYALYRCSPPRSPTADRYLPITCSKNLVECCRCRNAIETQFASPHSSLGQSLLPFLGRHSLGGGDGEEGKGRNPPPSQSPTQPPTPHPHSFLFPTAAPSRIRLILHSSPFPTPTEWEGTGTPWAGEERGGED